MVNALLVEEGYAQSDGLGLWELDAGDDTGRRLGRVRRILPERLHSITAARPGLQEAAALSFDEAVSKGRNKDRVVSIENSRLANG